MGAVCTHFSFITLEVSIINRKVVPNNQNVIKITGEAYEALAEVVNESGLSVKQAASLIILQAVENNLIVKDKGGHVYEHKKRID